MIGSPLVSIIMINFFSASIIFYIFSIAFLLYSCQYFIENKASFLVKKTGMRTSICVTHPLLILNTIFLNYCFS